MTPGMESNPSPPARMVETRTARIWLAEDGIAHWRTLPATEASRTVTAVALQVASPVSRVIGNFMLGLNRIGVPTQLFTDEAKAATWLENHLD